MCLFFIVSALLIFGVFYGAHGINASESERVRNGSAKISEEDEQLIDKFLDENLAIDPASIAQKRDLSQTSPSLASGFSLFAGRGVEKNVLNDPWLNLSSRKTVISFDYFYSRQRRRINNLNLYVFADYLKYEDLEVESDKKNLYARATGKIWVNETNVLAAGLSYLYQLSFDTNNAIKNEPVPSYRNEEVSLAPSWEKDLGDNYLFVAELELLNKKTQEPADNFNRLKLITWIKKKYGMKSENQVTMEAGRSVYEEGELLDLDGYPIENTRMIIESQSLGMVNHQYWNGNAGTNLKSKLVLFTQKDNGPGYDNYHYYSLDETIQFWWINWKFSSSLRSSYYQYPERNISSGEDSSEEIYNSIFEIDAKLERKIGDQISFNIETINLQSNSNDPSMEYVSDSVQIGLMWLF